MTIPPGNLLVAVVALSGAFASTAYGLDLKSQIDPLAKPLIDNHAVVGFVVGIYKDGDTQILGYGETNKGDGHAPSADTIYEIGSVSKVFTSTILADMVQAGDVKLDDAVQKYLPGSVKMPSKDGQPITLLHLATHTSGLPRMPNNMTPADPANPYADYTVEQMYAFLNGCKLERAPGDYEYSNLGGGLLGHVLALKEGVPYEKMLVDHICRPLVMQDTRITLKPEQVELVAPPYDAELKPAKNWDLPTLAGAGAIRSTARDMIRFIAANLRKDSLPLSQAMQLAQRKQELPKLGQPMGLGWHLAAGGEVCGHSGMTGGYHAYLALVPSRNVGVVVLSNTANGDISALGERISRLASGAKVETVKERKAIEVDPATLAPYIGVYALSPLFALNVTVEDGKLMSQATGQEKFQLFAETPTKFFLKVVDAQTTFVPDADGKVNQLILHQGGQDQTARRVTEEGKFYFPKPRETIKVDPPVLATYAGEYSLAPGEVLTVTVEDRRLMAQITNQPKFQLFAESPTNFFYTVVDAQITFVPGADGKVDSLILHQNGRDLTAPRMAAGEKVETAKQRTAIDVDPSVLATYAGTYTIVPQFALTVTVEDGKLMVQATAQPKFQVFAEAPTEFFYKVVDAQITFVPNADGKVDKLILHQNGQDLKGTRKDQ